MNARAGSRAVRRLRRCLCCGGPMPPGALPREELYGALLAVTSPAFARIVRRLARRPGRAVTVRDLADHVHADDPGGGPEWAEGGIRKAVHDHGQLLVLLGWRIASRRLGGRGGIGYWLEALP